MGRCVQCVSVPCPNTHTEKISFLLTDLDPPTIGLHPSLCYQQRFWSFGNCCCILWMAVGLYATPTPTPDKLNTCASWDRGKQPSKCVNPTYRIIIICLGKGKKSWHSSGALPRESPCKLQLVMCASAQTLFCNASFPFIKRETCTVKQ